MRSCYVKLSITSRRLACTKISFHCFSTCFLRGHQILRYPQQARGVHIRQKLSALSIVVSDDSIISERTLRFNAVFCAISLCSMMMHQCYAGQHWLVTLCFAGRKVHFLRFAKNSNITCVIRNQSISNCNRPQAQWTRQQVVYFCTRRVRSSI